MSRSRCYRLTHAALAAVVAALSVAAGGGVAQAATAHQVASQARVHHGIPVKLVRHASSVPPRPLAGRGQASSRFSVNALDSTRQVDALAFCGWNALGALEFSAREPFSVRPTVSGNQSIAFRFNVTRSDGVSLGSTDWWQGEVDSTALFHPWARASNLFYYKFMNMRTRQLYNNVEYDLYPSGGVGYHETITVFWYINGSWSRSITFAPAWSTGANPSLYCR